MPVGSIRKRASGSWEYRIWVGGVRKSFVAPTKAEAVEKYKEYCRKNIIIDPKTEEYTVEQWAHLWLRDYKKPSVAYNTYKNYALYAGMIIGKFGNKKLSEVKTIDVERFLAAQKNKSVSAQHHIYITLRAIFETAVENELIPGSPVKKHTFKNEQKAPQYFAEQTIQEILQAAKTDPDGYIVELLLYTGLRSSELRALRWTDIKDGVITVRHSIARTESGLIEKSPKSGKERTIPVIPDLQEVLARIDHTGEWVLHHPDGKPFGDKTLWRHYDAFFARNNIPRLSPHKCRHTYATYLIRSGVPIYDVKQLLGHSTVRVTEIYAHHLQDAVLEQGKKLHF